VLVERLTTTCDRCGEVLHGELRLRGYGEKYEWWNLGSRSQGERPTQCSNCQDELDDLQAARLIYARFA
jgi:hypothetical protein